MADTNVSFIPDILPCSLPIILALIGIAVWAVLMFTGQKRWMRVATFCLSFGLLYIDIYRLKIAASFAMLFFFLAVALVMGLKTKEMFRKNRSEILFYLVMLAVLLLTILFFVIAVVAFFDLLNKTGGLEL